MPKLNKKVFECEVCDGTFEVSFDIKDYPATVGTVCENCFDKVQVCKERLNSILEHSSIVKDKSICEGDDGFLEFEQDNLTCEDKASLFLMHTMSKFGRMKMLIENLGILSPKLSLRRRILIVELYDLLHRMVKQDDMEQEDKLCKN